MLLRAAQELNFICSHRFNGHFRNRGWRGEWRLDTSYWSETKWPCVHSDRGKKNDQDMQQKLHQSRGLGGLTVAALSRSQLHAVKRSAVCTHRWADTSSGDNTHTHTHTHTRVTRHIYTCASIRSLLLSVINLSVHIHAPHSSTPQEHSHDDRFQAGELFSMLPLLLGAGSQLWTPCDLWPTRTWTTIPRYAATSQLTRA